MKESVNKNADRVSWNNEIQRELAGARERQAETREVEMRQYEKGLEAWKEMNSK